MNSISFITAFDTDRNISKEYNRLIDNINDEWIFIRDGDCLFLTSDYGNRIEKIIEDNKYKYDIIGCMTNRLNFNNHYQRVEGVENEDSVTAHIKLANSLWETFGTICNPTTNNQIGAMCLMFKRSVWEKVHFDEKDSMHFDSNFCERAMKLGYKIGISQGLYVFHLYRWEYKEDPQKHTDHLIRYSF